MMMEHYALFVVLKPLMLQDDLLEQLHVLGVGAYCSQLHSFAGFHVLWMDVRMCSLFALNAKA
jgi:hypothetical protein